MAKKKKLTWNDVKDSEREWRQVFDENGLWIGVEWVEETDDG